MPGIVDWYMDGRIEIDSLITHTMPLEEINTALDHLMHRGESIRSVITSRRTKVAPVTDLPGGKDQPAEAVNEDRNVRRAPEAAQHGDAEEVAASA